MFKNKELMEQSVKAIEAGQVTGMTTGCLRRCDGTMCAVGWMGHTAGFGDLLPQYDDNDYPIFTDHTPFYDAMRSHYGLTRGEMFEIEHQHDALNQAIKHIKSIGYDVFEY